MVTNHDTKQGTVVPSTKGSAVRLSTLVVFCVFAGIITFFLFTEHRAHLFRFLPYLLLFLCPLLHLFHHRMHGGNPSGHAGHHGGHSGGSTV
jgi:hypothetical protein